MMKLKILIIEPWDCARTEPYQGALTLDGAEIELTEAIVIDGRTVRRFACHPRAGEMSAAAFVREAQHGTRPATFVANLIPLPAGINQSSFVIAELSLF
jgi:hypothetical protein